MRRGKHLPLNKLLFIRPCYSASRAEEYARGKDLLSRSRGHCAEGEASRAASGLAGARRTTASAAVPRRRGEEVPRPPVRRRRRARATVVTRKVNGALRSLAGLFVRLAGLFVRLAGLFVR
jgi:hypothetical protein